MPNASALRERRLPPRAQLIAFRRTQIGLERTAYQLRINSLGTNPLMKFTLTYLQHMMVWQDGPQTGQFIPPAQFHHEQTRRLHEALTSRLPHPRVLDEIHRDGAKSSFGTVAVTLMAAAELGFKNIVIISANSAEKRSRMDTIIDELNNNERLMADYPGLAFAKDQKGQWVKNTDFEVHLENGAVIKAYEVGGKLRGRMIKFKRVDLVILDDPETEDHEYSEILRNKFWDWLPRVVLRAMTRYAPLIWEGTPVGASSALVRASNPRDHEDDPGYGWRGMHQPIAIELDGSGGEIEWQEAPAIIPFIPTAIEELEDMLAFEGEDAVNELVALEEAEAARWYKPSWPARFSPLDIARMMNEGDPAVAQQELMLRPVSRKSNPFDVGALEEYAYKKSHIKRPKRGVVTYKNRRLGPVYCHIDSAESTEPTADNTAIGWGAKDQQTGKAILLGMFYGKIEVPDQLDLLKELHDYWGFRVITHEKSMIEKTARQFAKRTHALPFEAVEMSTVPNAKHRRIRLGAGNYTNAILIVPNDEKVINPIKLEMKKFPGGKDDALDMLDHLTTKILASSGSSKPPDPTGVAQPSRETMQILDPNF